MRKLFAVSLAVMTMAPGLALARGNHPMAGCGLGYVLFSNKENDKVSQILGATTNGTSGNQTFGITSGTSGCTEDGAVKFVKAAEVFAEVNLDSIRHDVAVGDGEFVRAFASLLATDQTQVPTMVKMLHDNYASLFPTADTSSAEMLQSLKGLLS
jgi:hypothetical protein